MGCRGNHELGATRYNKYYPYSYNFSGSFYSFDYGIIHISVVDLYTDFSIGSEQLTWLENDLNSSNRTWKFVLLHEPAYTDTSAHEDNIEVQNLIIPICKQNNVKLIFSGHNHYYAHNYYDDTHHLTLGGGGAPLYNVNQTGTGLLLSESTLHFAKITATQNQAIFDVIRSDGSLLESFILNSNLKISKIKTSTFAISNRNNMLFIEQNKEGLLFVKVFNVKGQCVFTETTLEKYNVMNLSNLTSGFYFVSVRNNKNESLGKAKIIVE